MSAMCILRGVIAGRLIYYVREEVWLKLGRLEWETWVAMVSSLPHAGEMLFLLGEERGGAGVLLVSMERAACPVHVELLGVLGKRKVR